MSHQISQNIAGIRGGNLESAEQLAQPRANLSKFMQISPQSSQISKAKIRYCQFGHLPVRNGWTLFSNSIPSQTLVMDYPVTLFETSSLPSIQWQYQSSKLHKNIEATNVRSCMAEAYTYLLFWITRNQFTPKFTIIIKLINQKVPPVAGILIGCHNQPYSSESELILTSLLHLTAQFKKAKLTNPTKEQLNNFQDKLDRLNKARANLEQIAAAIESDAMCNSSKLLKMSRQSKIKMFPANLKAFLQKSKNQIDDPAQYLKENLPIWFSKDTINLKPGELSVSLGTSGKEQNSKNKSESAKNFRLAIEPTFLKVILQSNFVSCAEHNDIIASFSQEIKSFCPDYNLSVEYSTDNGRFLVGFKSEIMFDKFRPHTPLVLLGHLTRTIDMMVLAHNALIELSFDSNTLNLQSKAEQFHHYIKIYRDYSKAVVDEE